ncbi:glycoside hydrolase family 9 protein [Bacteroidales bacterium]|nr:glycoside hydrolase family 9 protein [Bacteroidales bacterium]
MNILSNHLVSQTTRSAVIIVFLLLVSCTPNNPVVSEFIIVDQFGYIPEHSKIAVLKNPQVGFDSAQSFNPGISTPFNDQVAEQSRSENTYAVIDANSGKQVYKGTPVAWNDGKTDDSSGDQVWHFNFSSLKTNGTYYILDIEKNVRSFDFEISSKVYNEVLKHAVRTFFYQRIGHDKDAKYAGDAWADSASHIGPLQDKNCRVFNDPDNEATEKDVSGGWYDAGDYNKYTSWTANYIITMMLAYLENPNVWGDDYNIPESGNGIPDLLDEAKWGADHLLRLQLKDGSLISIVDEGDASPPSLAKDPSLYGLPNTSGTLTAAGAYALSSKVFRTIGMAAYADSLLTSAERAWQWADANPAVVFRNNDVNFGTQGIGAGQQEVDEYRRNMKKLQASVYLYEATKNATYQEYFDAHYTNARMLAANFVYPYEHITQDVLLYYTTLPGATESVVNKIKEVYIESMENSRDNFPAFDKVTDPYLAHLISYTWGSNATKSAQGGMFYNVVQFGLNEARNKDAIEAALGYIHYMHGVNPLNKVYLSNMYAYGAENSVNEFFHAWFSNGSERWDRVGESTYGPAPGFVVGGPNPGYNWDDCCPDDCNNAVNNNKCFEEDISPPKGQPKQKSYKDFNNSWPLNSWSVTENANGYQLNYIRLLSKFVYANSDARE